MMSEEWGKRQRLEDKEWGMKDKEWGMKDKVRGRVLRCWVGNMKYHDNLFNTFILILYIETWTIVLHRGGQKMASSL